MDLSGLFGPPQATHQATQPSAPAAAHPAANGMPQQQQPPAASIDEVDMDANSDEERTPASKLAGSRKRGGSSDGGASSDDDDGEAAARLGASRCDPWHWFLYAPCLVAWLDITEARPKGRHAALCKLQHCAVNALRADCSI